MSELLDLTGRVALVTGAGRGIAQCTFQNLAFGITAERAEAVYGVALAPAGNGIDVAVDEARTRALRAG